MNVRVLPSLETIQLSNNENPLGASPKAIAAATLALAESHFYPDGDCHELKTALAHFLSVTREQITIGNGSENILELIVKAYLHRDNTAIISQYAFLTISLLLQSYGTEVKVIPVKHWSTDITAMIQAVDEKTRVLFLVNPNNPTGTYTNHADFLRLMEAVPPEVIVVVDEAYAEYISCADYPDTLSYLKKFPNLIVTRTFSKIYGLAALRVGYAVSSPQIANKLNRSKLPFNVNAIAAKAACAALQDQQHVRNSAEMNRQGLRQMQDGLRGMGLAVIPPSGNFVTVEVGDAEFVYQRLLQEGVIVRPLHAYGMPHHIRVSIGSFEQNARFLAACAHIKHTSPC
jgi:histidinol-phosphate aminotransferase